MTLSLGSVSLRVEIDARYLHESLQKAIKSFKAPDAKLSIDSVEALRDAKLFRAKVSAPIIIPVQLSLSAATKQYEEFAIVPSDLASGSRQSTPLQSGCRYSQNLTHFDHQYS